MIQSNTSREIFYIFLWLMGIILFYGLIHTFMLEPSQKNGVQVHSKKTFNADIRKKTRHNPIIKSENNPTTKLKTETKKLIDKKVKTIQTLIQQTSVPTLPKVSSKPKIKPSIPTAPQPVNALNMTLKKTTEQIKEKYTNKDLSTSTEVSTKELSREEKMNLLETNRQNVIKEAESARQNAISELLR